MGDMFIWGSNDILDIFRLGFLNLNLSTGVVSVCYMYVFVCLLTLRLKNKMLLLIPPIFSRFSSCLIFSCIIGCWQVIRVIPSDLTYIKTYQNDHNNTLSAANSLIFLLCHDYKGAHSHFVIFFTIHPALLAF